MRIAYADPPYIGQNARYYAKYGGKEVNHRLLVAYLEEFDGWALSASARSLFVLLPLCPPDARIGAWVRRAPQLKRGISPVDAWEPVLYRPARNRWRDHIVLDWCMADPINGFLQPRRHIVGRKPEPFCYWLFDLLGALPSDEFIDIFPGSGAVGRYWQQWAARTPLRMPSAAHQEKLIS